MTYIGDAKVALVTGSTRGIGRAIAERLGDNGFRVVIHGRDQKMCAEVVEETAGAAAIACDLANRDEAEGLVSTIIDRLGRLDVLVNNAGVALDNYITGVTDERWDATLETNLTAPFVLIRAAARVMKTQGDGGVIVNLASTSGEHGNAGQAAYGAAKAGLHGLTLTAAKELGRFGIRVNSVAPVAGTEMNGLDDPERADALAKQLPLGRVASTADVADLVGFLVSDRARSITGELLHVDGGFHLL